MVVQLPRTTTEGQRSQGGASRSLGGRDDARSLSSSKRRWIPPSSLRRDALTQDNQHDITFRKIRGLLNKLTPETFDKLGNELLNVGLSARAVLGGLILLIFQKALDEPKYCSMYALLCKRLSEDAPNFDPPNSPCTFNRLLLQQCQDEFERRRSIKETWGNNEDGRELSTEDEEQRQAARRKMVGNLRFIGELGKLQIIHKSILYHCIEECLSTQLLEKGRRSSGDLAEDLECLCQIMRTSGRILDSPEAENLMEQYFARIRRLSTSLELNLRIRFMLQDVLDLREAGWRPRKMAIQEGPRTITEVREQAARDLGIYIPPPSANNPQGYSSGMVSPLSTTMPTFFPQSGVPRTGMEDVFGMPMGGAASLGTGPGVISSQPDKFTPYDSSNGYGGPVGMGGGGGRGDGPFSHPGGRNNRQGMQGNFPGNNSYYQNKHFTNSFNRQQNNPQYQQGGPQQGGGGGPGGYNNSGTAYSQNTGKELPPRFKKMYVSGPGGAQGGGPGGGPGAGVMGGPSGGPGGMGGVNIGGGGGGGGGGGNTGGGGGGGVGGGVGGLGLDRVDHHHGELSLRPTSAHMTLKPKTPGLLPQSALSSSTSNESKNERSPLVGHYPSVQPPNQKPSSMASIMHKDPPLVIKQIPADKSNKNKKEKGPTRKEYMRSVSDVVDALVQQSSAPAADKDSKNKGGVQSATTATNGVSATNGAGSSTTNGAATDAVAASAADGRLEKACQAYKDIKLPDRFSTDAARTLFATILKLDESGRELGSQFLVKLRTDNILAQDKMWDGLKQVLSEVETSVSECPRGKGQLAEVLAQLVVESVLSLSELAEPMQAGTHFPLYLLILQHLHKLVAKQKLTDMFNESKVNLLNLVPESERTKEQLSDLLEDRQLSFLFPLLRIQSELSTTLAKDPSPHAFFKHIKDTLDVKHHTAPAFINALVTVLIKHITQESTLAAGVDKTVNPDKSLTEKEKELLTRFQPVLQAFLHAHNNLQMIAIYALQVYTYTNNFPKGMLLRWFIYLYDLEIVEEEAFLAWKEDVNDDYPGKGKALFQVNQWLTWLQETEEDDEDEDEDEN